MIIKILRFIGIIVIVAGCGKSDKELVYELQNLFQAKQYRQLIVSYEQLSHSLKTTEEQKRAQELYEKSYSIVSKSRDLIASGDSLARIGFANEAFNKYTKAFLLEPSESTIVIKLNTISLMGKPIYRYSGRIGACEFVHTFHTKWVGDDLLPDFVEIKVTNKSVLQPTVLAKFVPSFFYREYSRTGPHALVIIADKKQYINNKLFTKFLWRGETETGKVSYTNANIIERNPTLSHSEVFKRIIIGNDEACFINMVGFQYIEIRGLSFVGYE